MSVTPSAISHQIKGLESFLGLELFRRTKRKVILTEAGESYLRPIKSIFEQLENATSELKSKQKSGSLRLAVAPAFLTRWLMPRMERFQERYPDAQLYWLMGTDQWKVIQKWTRPQHLASIVKFIVVSRGEEPAIIEGFECIPLSGAHSASATFPVEAL